MPSLSRSYAEMNTEQRRHWAEATLARMGASGTSASARQRSAESGIGEHRRANLSRMSPLPQNLPQNPKTPTAREQPRRASSSQVRRATPVSLSRDDVSRLGSVNSRTKSRLKGLGIDTVEDLIHHFPHRHDDFTDVRTISQVVPGETQTVKATIWEVSETGRGRMKNAQAILGDETGNIRVIWFNQGYLAKDAEAGYEHRHQRRSKGVSWARRVPVAGVRLHR